MHKLNIYDVGTISLITLYLLFFVVLPYGSTPENGFETYETNFKNVGVIKVNFSTYHFGAGTDDYTIYADSDYDNIIHSRYYQSYSKSITDALLEKNRQLGNSKLSDRELFDSVISTIQHYRYVKGGGGVKNVRNTLVSGIGDCDERVLLAGGILSQMGYDVALIIYPPYLDIDAGHMQLGVKVVSTGSFKTIEGYAPIELTSPIPMEHAYMEKYELQIDGLKPTPIVIRYGVGNKAYA